MRTYIKPIAALAWVAAATFAVTGAVDATAKEKKSVKAPKETSKQEVGFIGVYMQDLTDDVRQGLDLKVEKGVLISGVHGDGPAAAAGIEEGDVVVSFDGKTVASPDELRGLVRDVAPGTKAKLEVIRDEEKKTFTVTVGERPEREMFSFEAPDFGRHDFGDMRGMFASFGGPRLGIEAHELDDDELASYFSAKSGVLVLGVEDESVAAKAGVMPGDVIQSIGEEKIDDVGDLRDAMRDFEEGEEFTIGVLRRGKAQSLKATMDEAQYSFHGFAPRWRERVHVPSPPRVRVDRDAMRDEIDQLKREIREMKERLERQDG